MESVCKNCGQPLTGKYCSSCGEKVYTDHDKSISHLFEEAFHFITHLDGKFIKSIVLLLKKPGFLSAEFCQGVRKKYFKPVSLFLIGVVIYLLLPFVQGLNLDMDMMTTTFKSIGINVVENAAINKAAHEHVTLDALAEHYNAKSAKFAKLLLFLVLPVSALALMLLFRKKKKYYFDHFILATELNTFFLYVCFILIPLIMIVIGKLAYWIGGFNMTWGDYILGPIMILLLLFAFTVAFRRFYEIKPRAAIFKALVFLLLHSFIVFILYRFVLYFIILAFI